MRFTLTMWDVKVNAVSVLTPPATGFTLTMWDVKSYLLLSLRLPPLVLP